MEDFTGKKLGRFQVSALIGRGGMATVYKARDPGLERTVALKLLHPHLSADPTFVARFQREARAVAALRHPNIVQVYEFDKADDEYFMVMEYVDGPTLATLLGRLSRKGKKLSPEEILRIFEPLCSAIDYANGEGMVHRDIKPCNIMLTAKGVPIVGDYGIARISGATSYTMPGTVVGSAQYMSPEQAQGQPADGRSDIYSLGVCLFEALTGRTPYEGETTASILAQHLTAPVPSARVFNPDLPAVLDAVLARALAKDPANRYQTAADLAADLETALKDPTAPVRPQADAPAVGPPPVAPVADTPMPPLWAGERQPAGPFPRTYMHAPAVTPSGPLSPVYPAAPGYASAVSAPPRRGRNWPLLIVLSALVLAGGGVGAAYLVHSLGGDSSTTTSGVSSTVTLGASSTAPVTAGASTTATSALDGSSTTAESATTSSAAPQPVDLSSKATLSASSVRASEGSNTYEPAAMVDGDPASAWVEGVPGYGGGEWVLFSFFRAVTVTEIRIIPGMDKVKSGWDRWWSNGRVHTFRLEFSDGSTEEHSLADVRQMQPVALEQPRSTTFVRFVIVSAYPAENVPNMADDTCVAELRVWGTQ